MNNLQNMPYALSHPVGPLGPVVYGFPHFTGLDSRKLEHKWKTMDRWQKWRSYSCPTNDLLADLIQEQDNKVVNNGCLVLPLLSIPTLSLANKAGKVGGYVEHAVW